MRFLLKYKWIMYHTPRPWTRPQRWTDHQHARIQMSKPSKNNCEDGFNPHGLAALYEPPSSLFPLSCHRLEIQLTCSHYQFPPNIQCWTLQAPVCFARERTDTYEGSIPYADSSVNKEVNKWKLGYFWNPQFLDGPSVWFWLFKIITVVLTFEKQGQWWRT